MKADNPFDQHLEINKQIPSEIRDAAVFVTDTLDIAWKSAQAVFGSGATTHAALEIYDRIVSRAGGSNDSSDSPG
ncbi:MAG: hypothetical protein OQK24_15080 [Magnetovibrio sp.]|nr:hypothetical protein [Magnetovibrio sp.]